MKKPSTVLDRFPVVGATIISYACEKEEITGDYFIGLVVKSGSKQFEVSWRGFDKTEKYESIEGRNEDYSFFSILGYINYEDYYKYKKWHYNYKKIKKIIISPEPCETSILLYKAQKRKIKKIKENEKLNHADDYSPETNVEVIGEGKKIKFIYVHLLDEPKVMEKFSRKGEDSNTIYVDTKGEDNIYIDKGKGKDRKAINKRLVL